MSSAQMTKIDVEIFYMIAVKMLKCGPWSKRDQNIIKRGHFSNKGQKRMQKLSKRSSNVGKSCQCIPLPKMFYFYFQLFQSRTIILTIFCFSQKQRHPY